MNRSRRAGRAPVTAVLAAVAIAAALLLLGRDSAPSGPACEGVGCGGGPGPPPAPEAEPHAVAWSAVCPSSGYLCAGMEAQGDPVVRRWRGFTGTLVARVPLPDVADPELARALQQAAVAGIRAWNNEPFPILIDLRGEREAHVTVRWRRTLEGARVGATRTRWSSDGGLEVEALELTTHDPYAPDAVNDPARVRLTAAHEMGHALGLPHSDAARDVMYPTNSATSVTARDRRTMEALYEIPDGARITR